MFLLNKFFLLLLLLSTPEEEYNELDLEVLEALQPTFIEEVEDEE